MKVTLDASEVAAAYSRAFRHFATLPGFHGPTILRAEAGSILKRWAGLTKVGNKQDADERARYRAGKRAFGTTSIDKNPYGISVNTGARGGYPGAVWIKTRGGFSDAERDVRKGKGYARNGVFQLAGVIAPSGAFTPSWIHWRGTKWARIKQGAQLYGTQLAALLPAAQRSIGFSRQAVIQIADALNIDLAKVQGQGISPAGIAKARAAMASTGKEYRNGQGWEGGDRFSCFVQILCTLPHGDKIGMQPGLLLAMSGRAKFIETSWKKGAFDSVRASAKAFPNLINISNL